MNFVLRCGGSQNVTGYCQRLVTRDLDEAGRVLDPEQHRACCTESTRGLRSTCR